IYLDELSTILYSFFSHHCAHPPSLHSFPTRRSSDLRIRHAQHVLQHGGGELVLIKLCQQTDDASLCRCQCTSPSIGGVSQLECSGLHAAAHIVRDRSFAGESIGRGTTRDFCYGRDVTDGDHDASSHRSVRTGSTLSYVLCKMQWGIFTPISTFVVPT